MTSGCRRPVSETKRACPDRRAQDLCQIFNDSEIRNQAARAIYSDFNFEPYASGEAAPIHIIVNDGIVQLKGIVAKTYMRDWAVNTVNTNTKAFRVYDDLKVEWP